MTYTCVGFTIATLECLDRNRKILMQSDWHFRPHIPGASIREPIAGAFFASDAVSEPGEALVREGIQNSLDATPDGSQTFVRISLANGSDALTWDQVSQYYASANIHYTADGSGLRSDDILTQDDACSVLIFEDFGTHGLQGDPATPYPPKDKSENNFFHFFRAEGRSDKDSSKRGSWGLGKDTFFRASRVNTIFGLTVRDDDHRRLLMGKAILKSHYAGDDYCQDGYFGVLPDADSHLVMPIEDNNHIELFLNMFHLERQNDPGLSVIVPWLDSEITQAAIIQAVLRNYFYSIFSGDLDVMVKTSGVETLLDKNSLLSEANKLTEDQSILPLIELAQWAVCGDADDSRYTINAPDSKRAWDWNRNLFSDDTLQKISAKLQNKERIAIRVPVTVRKKGGLQQQSYFDVYVITDDSNERARPVFIRDGIIVSDVRAPFMRGIRALVVVNDPPLSEFLRQAENPSHTMWQGQQLKADYVSGVSDLRFVVQSVRRIHDMLIAEDKKQDKRLLSDIFPIPGKGGKQEKPPPPSPTYFSINPVTGGFRVVRGKVSLSAHSLVEMHVAYDVRRGSPLKRYRNDDFQLNEAPISYKYKGVEVIEAAENRMVIRISDPEDFYITVTGFDRNRQVYVRVDKGDGTNADSTD